MLNRLELYPCKFPRNDIVGVVVELTQDVEGFRHKKQFREGLVATTHKVSSKTDLQYIV